MIRCDLTAARKPAGVQIRQRERRWPRRQLRKRQPKEGLAAPFTNSASAPSMKPLLRFIQIMTIVTKVTTHEVDAMKADIWTVAEPRRSSVRL